MMYVGIDPGVHACGVAVVGGEGKLVAAAYVKEAGDIATTTMLAVREAVGLPLLAGLVFVGIEFPQVYRGRARGNADTQDLLELSFVVGRLIECFAWAEFKPLRVDVQSWKRNMPTDVLEARLHKPPPMGLSAEEWSRVRMPAKSYRHNVVDAIALARWLAALGQHKSLAGVTRV